MGSAGEIVDQLGRLADEGLDEVQFVYFDPSSESLPAFLAQDVLPQAAKL